MHRLVRVLPRCCSASRSHTPPVFPGFERYYESVGYRDYSAAMFLAGYRYRRAYCETDCSHRRLPAVEKTYQAGRSDS